MNELKIDTWLAESTDAPAAIVLREYLTPVEGKDGVFFPPTFAAAENSREFPGGYVTVRRWKPSGVFPPRAA